MSCQGSNNTCRTVAKISSVQKKPSVECALKDACADERLEAIFQKTMGKFKSHKVINIDYANEYLTRLRESDLGTLAFFIVDDLLDTLNLDATRAIFSSESGFKLRKVKNADTIRLMFHLAENVKLLDTVAEKTLDWLKRFQRKQCDLNMEEHVWNIWDIMNLSEYIRMYKEIYECMPGDESRSYYEATSLNRLLNHCNSNRTAQVIEYTVSNSEPTPICSKNTACSRGGTAISNSGLRKAAQVTARKRALSQCPRRAR